MNEKKLKEILEKAFDKETNYQQIINRVKKDSSDVSPINKGNISKYALVAGATVGVGAVAYLIRKKMIENKSLKLELN